LTRVTGRGFRMKFELLAHQAFPFSKAVRSAVLQMMNAESARVADLARLSYLLGELYGEAVRETARRKRVKVELVGCHGQTLYHQGEPAFYLGRKLAATWQTGEGAIVAARTGVPTVSDFRPADLAVGGKGAPLVPFLDYLLYRNAKIGRIVQNIGGIANLSAIPAGATDKDVIAFDTGPGNMVIDAVTEQLTGCAFDRDGKLAAAGKVIEPALQEIFTMPFFRKAPPKTTGREQFGREFLAHFLWLCKSAKTENTVATATALTARSIADAIRRLVLRRGDFHEVIVSGGGAKNPTLMRMLKEQLPSLTVRNSDELGLPAAAKEAVAFALLAYQTWHRLPSNMPSATGAARPAVLGKISYP
ncbi:MAG: anhydro-N-acetylmuramic acid kinase, partial [Candidatus Korobacteraceae bacterium]